MTPQYPPLAKPQELADALAVSKSTVIRWCREGRLKNVKLRGTIRVYRSEIERAISQGIE